MLTGLRLAVGLLSVLPVGALPPIERRDARWAMLLAPVAVVPLALAAAGVGWLAHLVGMPMIMIGLLVVGSLAAGTRALHLDGLADVLDGLGSGWDREKSLRIMRSGDVGPMGVVALIIVLGLQSAAFGSLIIWAGPLVVALIICCSRTAVWLVCAAGVPAARPDGLGAQVAGTVPRWFAVAGWMVIAGLLAAATQWWGARWWTGALAAAVAAVSVCWLIAVCRRRLGGVSGDVMGAAVEIALTTIACIVML